MAWNFHAPSGTYRDHTLSSTMRREAIPEALSMRFLKVVPEFKRKMGDTYTYTRIRRLPAAVRIGEMDQLPDGRPAIETRSVSISRWGFKIPLTEMEEDLTKYNLPDEFKSSLREQITLTMDIMGFDALKLTPMKYVPTAAGFNLDTDGSATGTSTRNVQVVDIRNLRDIMRTGNSGNAAPVPPFRGGNYVMLVSTRVARGIKSDSEFKDWHAPTSAMQLGKALRGDALGVIEGVEIYESNHIAGLADLVPNSVTTGEAVIFGADAAGYLDVRSPDLRMSIPIPDDLGTVRFMGWVGLMEAFHTWETAPLFRAIHVTSV